MTETEFYLKVKPCPFCGETDELEVTPLDRFVRCGGEDESVGTCVSVTCNRCGVDVYDHHHKETDYSKRLCLLLNKWNTREGANE